MVKARRYTDTGYMEFWDFSVNPNPGLLIWPCLHWEGMARTSFNTGNYWRVSFLLDGYLGMVPFITLFASSVETGHDLVRNIGWYELFVFFLSRPNWSGLFGVLLLRMDLTGTEKSFTDKRNLCRLSVSLIRVETCC